MIVSHILILWSIEGHCRIIIPVRYELSESPSTWMHPLEANLSAHIEHAQRFGAVYWDLNILLGLCREDVRMERNVNLPTCCYFYDSNQESKTTEKSHTRQKLLNHIA